jgi:sulfide dehydrogenase cytochrome subunit
MIESENIAMRQRAIRLTVLACSALLAFSFAGGARAAEVEKLVETCASCHGKDGASTNPDVPIIGGYSAEYIKSTLVAFKKKERPCPATKALAVAMCGVAQNLSAAEIEEVARYFARKKFVRANQKFDPDLAKKGKEIHADNCEQCHSESGSVASDDKGILAGQWMPYLAEQFKGFASGTRTPPKMMETQLKKVDQAGFEALVNYYGSFK